MKKITYFLVIAIAVVAVYGGIQKRSYLRASHNETTRAVSVGVQKASDSKEIKTIEKLQAVSAGQQEATITAKSSGTVMSAGFEIGKYVPAGFLLAKIDDTGSRLGIESDSFRSNQIRQAEFAVEQAEESLEAAEKAYKLTKKADSSSDIQIAAAKAQKELAEIQLQSAEANLSATYDSKMVTSPISGTVVKKMVSVGDNVIVGQTIAVISQTNKTKLQFYVDEETLDFVKAKTKLKAFSTDGSENEAVVSSVSPSADSQTKRFLIEAVLVKTAPAGTLFEIEIPILTKVSDEKNVLLPISAITIGQNEAHIFIAEGEIAKKIEIEIKKIDGERAEVSAPIDGESLVIVKGNKLLVDGERIMIAK